MYLRRDELQRIARPPAKLNLYLDVFGRRGDGFHELETLMVPVRLFDSLSISPAPLDAGAERDAIQLNVRARLRGEASDIAQMLPAARDNLVVRALELLRRHSGCAIGAEVELVKRIPAAAGLGGGSSDAAAALRLANVIWRLGWSQSRLAELAAELGSDVPFFLYGGTAVCRGRGERVEPVRDATPLHLVLVKPPVDLSTSEVYQAFDKNFDASSRTRPQIDALVSALRRGRLVDIGRLMRNSLQAAAATLTPWIERIRSAFDEMDFLGHQLSGSGSAYFGLCRHAQHARRLASILKTRQLGRIYALRSCP